jgi:hypothetical protein
VGKSLRLDHNLGSTDQIQNFLGFAFEEIFSVF